MKKSIIKVVCFMLIFAAVFASFTRIYSFKYNDGIYGLQVFYEQNKNINDVIFVGSSQVFENINTEVLWEEYGIASFDLAGSIQPIWNSYFYINEALKTQSPRLIVLDLFGVLEKEEFADYVRVVKNTYGMRMSADKINAIKVSASEDKWNNHFWEIPTYHMRYNELSCADYLPNQGVANWEAWKGFGINTATTVMERPEGFQTDEIGEITEKVEEYLKKICQLCQDNDVALLLIKAPSITDDGRTMKYNRAAEIAKEYDVPFIDFNRFYDEMELDFSEDMADNYHLNYKGNVKYTRYLAEYIKNHYEIPDHRGEALYESYDIISLDCRMRAHNALVCDTDDMWIFMDEVQNENYLVIYSVCDDYKYVSNYEEVKNGLISFGIDLDKAEASSVWVRYQGNELFSSGNTYDYVWHTELAPYKDLGIKAGIDINSAPSVIFNRQEQTRVNSGINVIVYDTVTETIVDRAGFPIVDGVLQYNKK